VRRPARRGRALVLRIEPPTRLARSGFHRWRLRGQAALRASLWGTGWSQSPPRELGAPEGRRTGFAWSAQDAVRDRCAVPFAQRGMRSRRRLSFLAETPFDPTSRAAWRTPHSRQPPARTGPCWGC